MNKWALAHGNIRRICVWRSMENANLSKQIYSWIYFDEMDRSFKVFCVECWFYWPAKSALQNIKFFFPQIFNFYNQKSLIPYSRFKASKVAYECNCIIICLPDDGTE